MTVLNKKIFLTVSFIMLLAMAVFASIRIVNVDAMSDGRPAQYKYYTSYEIQPGDTLSSIAEEYITEGQTSVSEYVSEVKKINHLSSDKITSGKNIIIMYYSNEYK